MVEAGTTAEQAAAVSGHSIRDCKDIIDLYNIRTKKMANEAFAIRKKSEGI
jgi:hypothetical protein